MKNGRRRTTAFWELSRAATRGEEDIGSSSLDLLLAEIHDRAEQLKDLRADYFVDIYWHVTTDTGQASLSLSSETQSALLHIGVDLTISFLACT